MGHLSLDAYIATVLRRRWLVAGLATLVMLALATGVPHVVVKNEHRVLFGEGNPQLDAFDALENTYSAANSALIAVAPRTGTVFTHETLGAVEELTAAAWQAPHSTRVDSLTNYTHSEADGDDLVVEPLVDGALDLSDADLARVEKIALDSPEIAGRLVSRDGRVAGLVITFVLPEDSDPAVIEITGHLRSMLEKARAGHPDIDYYLTGLVVMNRAFAEATEDDMATLVPVVFLIIVTVAALLLRSVWGTVGIVLVLVFSVNTTMGFAGWMAAVFSPANAGVPIIVMAMSVASSVHVVAATLLGMSRGLGKDEAIAEALRADVYPVFLTAATTAIGFLSLNSSDAPPFHVLGNFVAFGVGCAFLYTVTLLPAALSLLPLRAPRARAEELPFLDRLGAFVVARRRVLLWSVALVTVGLATGIPRIELTDNWTKYFDDRYEFRRHTDFVVENLTSLNTLEYSLKAEREGGITDPAYLRAVDAFAEWFRGQPEVSHVQAFPDIMKRLNKNMHNDDPAFHRLPGDPELAAQYLLLYELSLPFGSDLNDRIDVGKSATRMTVVVTPSSSHEHRELDARAHAWLRANAPQLATEATGLTVVFAHLSKRNIESMLRGTIVAMALISLILVGVFRSVRLGLISLVPNFIPAIMTFGLWGWLVGEVGLAASVMVAISFGIVVDDTIHFLSKYIKARREGFAAPEAVRSAFRTVGHALWVTTAVLAAGFLVFASSGFEVSWSLGLMVTSTILFALAGDFLLLPTLLMALDRKEA